MSGTADEGTTISARKVCYGARDSYFACMGEACSGASAHHSASVGRIALARCEWAAFASCLQAVQNFLWFYRVADRTGDDREVCKVEREAYIQLCRKSWRKYFNERRRMDKTPTVVAVYANGKVKTATKERKTYIWWGWSWAKLNCIAMRDCWDWTDEASALIRDKHWIIEIAARAGV